MKTKRFEDNDGDILDVSVIGASIEIAAFEYGTMAGDLTACVQLSPGQIPALCETLLKAARKARKSA